MFISADLLISDLIVNSEDLSDDSDDFSVISRLPTIDQTYISNLNSNSVFFSNPNTLIGTNTSSEARGLIRFTNSITSTQTIESAVLTLHCTSADATLLTSIKSYITNVNREWRSTESTWVSSNISTFWQTQGADGNNDRSSWETPSSFVQVPNTNVYSVTYNVTYLVQQDSISSSQTFDFLISAIGGMLQCAENNNQTITYAPDLTLSVNTLNPGDGGSVESNFVEDGEALMENSFILEADTTPTLSYANLNGTGVEFQISLSDDYRNLGDLNWHYSTMSNAFVSSSNTGSFTIPSSDSIPLGGIIHYRIRSLDSTGMVSSWNDGTFLLPDLQVVNNNDGTATLTLTQDVFDLFNDKLIEDVEVDSNFPINNFGLNNVAKVGTSSTSESILHTRINLQEVGLHANSTINSANLILTRFSHTSVSPLLSMHPLEIDDWVESEANWRQMSNLLQWDEGGIHEIGASTVRRIDGGQASSTFTFPFEKILQHELNNGLNEGIELSIASRLGQESYSSSQNVVRFHTSEASQASDQPRIEIIYSWSQNTIVDTPELISPPNGHPVWNLSGHNLSGNTTPMLEWNNTISSSYEMILELANDEYFRDIVFQTDTGKQNALSSSSGSLYFDGADSLELGNFYHWRIIHYNSEERFGEWEYSSFLISSLSSTWLGGDQYELILEFGDESNELERPYCVDSTLRSGQPDKNNFPSTLMEIQDDSFLGQSSTIFKCDLTNYVLPQGYAVVSSSLTLNLDSFTNPIEVGAWESNQHNWSANDVTWNNYDATNNWQAPGARGSSRGQLLDTQSITSNTLSGDDLVWNITSATQNAIREMRSLDLIFDKVQSQSSTLYSTALFNSNSNTLEKPILSFIYILGSNLIPEPVQLDLPNNGDWLSNSDFDISPLTKPSFNWTPSTTQTPIVGWALELDSSSNFDSSEVQVFTSWNNPGFDLVHTSFELQADLDVGKKMYWRVRALSATNQLGLWSNISHFYLADLDISFLDAEHFSMELNHNEALPSIGMPNFEDTYITDENNLFTVNHYSEPEIQVGTTNLGYNASGLIRMSLDPEIQPVNGRVISANLKLSTNPSFSTNNVPIAIRTVLQPWDNYANSSNYGANNTSLWSGLGGRDIGTDIGPILDIQNSISGLMSWNVTSAVQQTLASGTNSLSLMLYNQLGVDDQMVHFYSVESSINKPYLELIWANGSSSAIQDYPEHIYPMDNSIAWDLDSHALFADLTPDFEWGLPVSSIFNPDSWRVFIDNNLSDEMEGQMVFDSRDNPSYFDMTNLKFFPPTDLDFSNQIQWSVQGIENGMIGATSNKTTYWLPEAISQEYSSTDAWVDLQEGSIVEELNFPLITSDTYLDQDDPNSPKDGLGLYVGVSPTNSSALRSSLISFDFSSLPMPSTYEILSATLELTEISNVSGLEDFYCSDTYTAWDESATWNSPNAGSNWIEPGAFHSLDSELPFPAAKFISSDDESFCNVTHILQRAIANGDESMSIIIQPEYDVNGAIIGQYKFADSENSNIDFRPNLKLEYRTTAPWIPIAPLLNTPADGATLWNYSSPIPRNVDSIDFSFTQSNNNATSWDLCFSSDQRIFDCIYGISDGDEDDWTWDSATNTLSFNDGMQIDNYGDEWGYWKIMSNQDHRLGEFSTVNKYRVPSDLGFDDGTGNYSYEMSRASIFELTGVLPEVLDASIDSNSLINTGSNSALTLGYDASTGGNNDILLDFDLSQIPWPTAITPTSMILQMTQTSSSQSSSPLTVSAHACSNFVESTVNYANSPTCGSSEVTRTTIMPNNNGIVEWDLTALAQLNFANGNHSFSIILDSISNSAGLEFYSSEGAETVQPKLVLEYVDNVGGISPPSQPVLSNPIDGSVLYDTSSDIISTIDSTTLSWMPSSGATSYIVSISDSVSIDTYDSRYDSEIVGNTFSTSELLVAGEVYSWWVQAINQSIPGPSSSRWSFGIGNPVHYYGNDGTFGYVFQDSSEVEQFGHVEIRDVGINDASADSNYGSTETMVLGTGCEGVAGSLCYGVISLDASQVPLDATQSVHSVELTLSVESWDLSGGAYEIEFSVHEFLNTGWTEYGLTWNTTGVNPGLTPGIDYNATALDVERYTSTDTTLDFDIGIPGMLVDDVRHWIIIANPISGGAPLDGLVTVYSSDEKTDGKPMIEVFTTNVSALNITSAANSFDADTPIVFEVMSFDKNGVLNNPYLPVGAIIEWSTTSGTISQINETRVSLSPTISGLQSVSACYGVICTSYDIDISPGIPVLLVASLNNTNSVSSQTLSADENVEVFAYVLDQFGNVVTSEVINFFSSNGTMGGINGTTFYPYSAGTHTLTAQWIGASTSLTVEMSVTITPGSPAEIEIQGCQEILPSATSCPVYATVSDQFGNLVWFDDIGTYSFSTSDGTFIKSSVSTPHSQPPAGEIYVGDYTGYAVGNSIISISTLDGLTDSIVVEVTHGLMYSLELITSDTSISADDLLFINATRIDVNGNRLEIIIPLENWTQMADGIITLGNLTTGDITTWEPTFQGTKTLIATHEGFSENISVFISRGLVSTLEILNNDIASNDFLFNITADQVITAEIKAFDSKGNLWYPSVDWAVSHSMWANQSELNKITNSTDTKFSPVHESNEAYIITATYIEQGISHEVQFSVKVSKGDLENFIISSIDTNGLTSVEVSNNFNITADQWVRFLSDLSDYDGNSYDSNILTWILVNKSSGQESDITSLLIQNSMKWDASESGNWQIYTYAVNSRGQNLTQSFDINVLNGLAVSIEIVASANNQDAGNEIMLTTNGFDSDGNIFPQSVSWLENGGLPYNINSTSGEGQYVFTGRISGNYTLSATFGASVDTVDVTVLSLLNPKHILVNVSGNTVEQLESLSISVIAYDEYWNLIDVPSSSRIDATGRGDVNFNGQGAWTIETLDEGKHTATITVGTITEEVNYTVEGNFAGFLAAGGSLYYVGGGLMILISLAVLALGFRFLRGDKDYYDEEEEEYEFDYDLNSAISSTSGAVTKDVATPPEKPPAKAEPEPVEVGTQGSEDWMIDYRLEDDGTEWGQSDDQIWYYRESDQSEWTEWTD